MQVPDASRTVGSYTGITILSKCISGLHDNNYILIQMKRQAFKDRISVSINKPIPGQRLVGSEVVSDHGIV